VKVKDTTTGDGVSVFCSTAETGGCDGQSIWAGGTEQVLNELPNVGLGNDHFHKPMAVQGQWIPYTGRVMAIDPAGRGKDETAYAVVKILNGQLFLLEAGGFHGGYTEEVLGKLVQVATGRRSTGLSSRPTSATGCSSNSSSP
jgi:hypothetical protein